MNFVTTRWRVYFVSHEVLWIDAACSRDISRRVATVLLFLFNFLWNHHVEDLVAGSIQAHDDSVYDFNEDEVEEFYCSETLL